ncbi:MAG TPA: hypothetical protein VFS42_09100 [Burkholderiaceae bacterium]|nr:hypothetical protein [Burkholderiaceae bacterium]
MIFRIVAALILISLSLCVGAWWFTHERRYLRWAINLIKLLVVLGGAFFGLLLLERAVLIL